MALFHVEPNKDGGQVKEFDPAAFWPHPPGPHFETAAEAEEALPSIQAGWMQAQKAK